jgi:hypothetical protein
MTVDTRRIAPSSPRHACLERAFYTIDTLHLAETQ